MKPLPRLANWIGFSELSSVRGPANESGCVILSHSATQPIPFHALSATAEIRLGAAQLIMRKGGSVHRVMGRLWFGLMALVATSSFFIHEINLWGRFSPIHLLSLWTLISIGLTVYYARAGNIKRHRQSATAFYWLALILTGSFTLLPGRIMNDVLLAGG